MACSHAHMFITCLITCLSYGTSLPAVRRPCKIKRGGHFTVLTGIWIFQNITIHRATNSSKSQTKIRLAFYFVERKKKLPGLKHKIEFFFLCFSCPSISKRVSDTKKTPPNMEIRSESFESHFAILIY